MSSGSEKIVSPGSGPWLVRGRSVVRLKLTVNGGLSRQDDDDELQARVGVLQVSEHGLHAVRPLGVLTEAGLALDGHPSILRDLTQLVGEPSEDDTGRRIQTHMWLEQEGSTKNIYNDINVYLADTFIQGGVQGGMRTCNLCLQSNALTTELYPSPRIQHCDCSRGGGVCECVCEGVSVCGCVCVRASVCVR